MRPRAACCEACGVSLTYHQAPPGLRCHYCGYSARVPGACPQCSGKYLRPFGVGTQRVEQALRELFPAARVARMDRDTMTRKGAHRELLRAFQERRVDVLVGTQMVAKGLDFPGVTLVGVVSADTALHFPDFRAAERTFQLLTQVVGRAGRGEQAGEVILQTYSPDHYAIQNGQPSRLCPVRSPRADVQEADGLPALCATGPDLVHRRGRAASGQDGYGSSAGKAADGRKGDRTVSCTA